MNEFEALKNSANGPTIFTYYAESELSISTIQYKTPDTSQKARQCFVTFLYTKIRTLCVTRFLNEFLKSAEGGVNFYMKKNWTLRYLFILKKQCSFRYVFIYKNPDTLCYIFIFKKMHFALRFYI